MDDSGSWFSSISDAVSNNLNATIGGVSDWLSTATPTQLIQAVVPPPTTANGEIIGASPLRPPASTPSAINMASVPGGLLGGIGMGTIALGLAAYFLLFKK